MMEGPGADSEEKHEPVSDIDTVVVVVVGLKALDPELPIREAIGHKRNGGDIAPNDPRRQWSVHCSSRRKLLINYSIASSARLSSASKIALSPQLFFF